MLNTMIEEGFLGKIGKYMSAVVGKLKNVISKIKNWASGIYKNISKRFDRQVKKDLVSLEKKMGLKRGFLKECFEYDDNDESDGLQGVNGYGENPPAVGVDFFRGPLADDSLSRRRGGIFSLFITIVNEKLQ